MFTSSYMSDEFKFESIWTIFDDFITSLWTFKGMSTESKVFWNFAKKYYIFRQKSKRLLRLTIIMSIIFK